MQATLLTRRTAGLVLAGFLAFLVVAGIAPRVQAQPLHSICTAGGIVDVAAPGGGESTPNADHTLKCLLCAGVSAPPSAVAVLSPSPATLAHALLPRAAAHLASVARAPLPARGPPLFS